MKLLKLLSTSMKFRSSSLKILLLITLFCILNLLQLANGAILNNIQVSTDPSTVQVANATLMIYGQTSTKIPKGGKIFITVPSDVDIRASQSLSCNFIIPNNVAVSSCQANGKQITIVLNQLLNADYFQLNIQQIIRNPISTTPTSSFVFESQDSTGVQLDYQSQDINLQASAGSLVSATLTSTQSQIVGASSELLVSIKLGNAIPQGGQIKVQFPKWNPNANSSQQQDYLSGSVSCKTASILSNTLQCAYSNNVLTVTQGIGNLVNANEVLGFRVSVFKNPMSTQPITTFFIQTLDQIGGIIDTGTGALQITDAASITSASFTYQQSSPQNPEVDGIVQETNVMRIQFAVPVPLDQYCFVKVTLPTPFNVNNITKLGVSGLFGTYSIITNYTKANNSFSFTQCSKYTPNTLSANIEITSLTLPNTNKETSSVKIEVSTSGGQYKIAALSSGLTFQAQPGSIKNISIVPFNPVLLSTTSFTLSFNTLHAIDLTTRLVFTFPSGYGLQNNNNCSIQNSNSLVNPNPSCVSSGQTITLNSILQSPISNKANQTIQFDLTRIQLPIMTTSKDYFTMVLYNQDSDNKQFYIVDQFQGYIQISLQPGALSAAVTPSVLTSYQIATYTFSITPDHYITQNGYILIVFPNEITVPDTSFSQSQCNGQSSFPTTPTCVFQSSNTLRVNNGFRLSTQPAPKTTYTLSIAGIKNPIDQKETSSFKIYTYTSTGSLIDFSEQKITVQMNKSPEMKSLYVTLSSYINADIATYTFIITATVPIAESNPIIIYFPSTVGLPSQAPSCSSDDTAIFNKITCSYNKQQYGANAVVANLDLKASISQINTQQTFRISVQNIRNPTTTKQTTDFTVNIMESQSSNSTINTSPAGVSISTNTPYTVSKANIKSNTTYANQYALYTITFYPEHDISNGGGVYLAYPTQITAENVNARITSPKQAITQAVNRTEIDQTARQITFYNAFTSNYAASPNQPIIIELTGFKNPYYQQQQMQSFVVKTFNQDSSNSMIYYIDQVTDGLTVTTLCNFPCETCSSTNPSQCLSCFQNGDNPRLEGESCVPDCSSGKFYDTKTQKCLNCTYPCMQCSKTATNCTSCGFQDFLYLYNNTCKNDCPDGFVKNQTLNSCLKCSNQCKTCTINPTTCTSCSTNSTLPYFWQSQCLKTCPANITIPNLTAGQCQICDKMCKTCSGKLDTCTSCESFMKFDRVLNTCTSVCQMGTQIFDESSGQCQYCDSNCNTCSGTVKTCTSCPSGKVLNTDNSCKQSCSNSDQIPINNVCQQCQLPCSQCKGTLNHCTKCQGDYLLYNTTCVQYCPEKFEPNNSTRQCILVGLICPSGFTVNEAGDGCIPNEIECPEGQIVNKYKTACVPAPGSPVPFPFLFFSAMLGLLVLGSYIKDKFFTKIYSNLIALLSLQEMLMYILLLAYAGAREIWPAFGLAFTAVITLMSANIIFYLLYKKDILKDEVFVKWQRSFPKTSKYIPLIALFLNFKVIRLFYSGFYGLESCLAQFEDPMKNLLRPLKMITYFNYVFVYIPIIVADIIIFSEEKWGYQVLVLAIETFILAFTVIILTYFEFRNSNKLIRSGSEYYTNIKPKSFANDTMVMAGMIDVDESTLIRSKVVDDDYEVFLRKKAFVSILNQVGKNYFNAQEKGLDLGGKIDQVMTKFDKSQLKLRRAFSLEMIKEEDSWYIPSDDEDKNQESDTNQPPQQLDDHDEYMRQRRFSFPLSPRSRSVVPDPMFRKTLHEIKAATKELLVNNVYADCKPPDKNQEKNRRKTVSRRTQTYLRELLHMEGADLQDSDLEIVLEDEAEIEFDYAQGLIDGVIDGISESESNVGSGIGKRRAKKKRKNLNVKRNREIPDFELADIMGDFEIDDLGNFIILRGEKGELLDKKERRVNRRGYLVDRFGNIINKLGQIIFKAVELDSDDEIPAPFGFEKRKKNLLNLGQDGEFKVEGQEKNIDDDEDLIDKELRMIKKSKKRRRQLPDGQIVEEEVDNEEGESSVDSLMAESPGKYQLDQYGYNEDEIIANVTKKKMPIKRQNQKNVGKKPSPIRQGDFSPVDSSRKKIGPLQNLPPKRIKREDTKEMFPSLAIEASEQKKLFKIAEQIGGMANQIADNQRKQMQVSINSNLTQHQNNQDIIDKIKQEHLKDLMNQQQKQTINASEKMLPPKPRLEKIYGNLNDVVSYEEQLLKEQYKNIGPGGIRAQSPISSQITTRMGFRPESSAFGDRRKIRGLESIYLQKFDKKFGLQGAKKQNKAKFRNTLQQFVDDPELLLDDGVDRQKQQDMSLMVADKLDKLQRQYITNTTTNYNFKNATSSTSLGFKATVGQAVIRKNGSLSGSMFNQDPSLETIKKGNWIRKE